MLHAPFSKILGLATIAGGTLLAMPSAAQSFQVEGQLQVQIDLVAACLINTDGPATGAKGLDFGTLNFGTHTSFFGTVNGVAVGGSGGGLTIKCTPGAEPTLSFNGGQNSGSGAGPGTRAMGFGGHYVTYDLFNDTTPILANTPISLPTTGQEVVFNINGTAYDEDDLIVGLYQDTVTVTLSL